MVYPQQLTLQMRKKQIVDIYGNPISFTGPNPLNLSSTIGAISNPWHDYTDFVSCDGKPLDESTVFTFTVQQTESGEAGAGQAVPKKTVTNTLTFERDAYDFIKAWLVSDVAAPLNQIEVQLTDISCGNYTGFVIKSSALQWCEFNALCTYELNLRQQDELTQCIERTMIADNWQGWFQNEPAGGKMHPRFSYCVEARPNGMLIIEWYLTSIIAFVITVIYTVIWAVLSVIILVVNAVISFVNTLGAGLSFISPLPTPADVNSAWANLMFEAAGCGREHPAPLIRDYISNVCDRCGVLYSATTADIFFAPLITIQKSDGIQYTEPNPHYNACFFYPAVKRGVRRFRNWNLLTGYNTPDTTTYYDPANQPIMSLSDLLTLLKKEYNAEWRIQDGYLWFKRKDWYYNDIPLYDFSENGADRPKIVSGICYQPQDLTVPASMNGLYRDDPADKCGHEANHQSNGDPLSFNNTIVNPLFHGILDKTSGFAAAKFTADGASTNYLYDAMQVTLDLELLTAYAFTSVIRSLANFVTDYGTYCLLLQTETVTLPKILIWDGLPSTSSGNPYLNAKCVRDQMNIGGTTYTVGHSAYPGTVAGITTPSINTRYLSQVPPGPVILPTLAVPSTIPTPLPWEVVNAPQTFVYGRTTGSAPDGVYEVTDIFGSVLISAPAILVNYPAYFNPYFLDTLWDDYHWLDDPYRRPKLNKTWSLKIPMCKADLLKLGVLGDGRGAKLLNTVTLDCPFYSNGVIKEIDVSYETGGDKGTGQYIEIKGEV